MLRGPLVSHGRPQPRHPSAHSPVRQEHDDVRTLGLSDGLPGIALEPLERSAERTPAAAADEESLLADERPDCGEGVFVRGLDPLVDVRRVAREDVGDEVVADAFYYVGGAEAVLVQLIGVRKDATFLK